MRIASLSAVLFVFSFLQNNPEVAPVDTIIISSLPASGGDEAILSEFLCIQGLKDHSVNWQLLTDARVMGSFQLQKNDFQTYSTVLRSEIASHKQTSKTDVDRCLITFISGSNVIESTVVDTSFFLQQLPSSAILDEMFRQMTAAKRNKNFILYEFLQTGIPLKNRGLGFDPMVRPK